MLSDPLLYPIHQYLISDFLYHGYCYDSYSDLLRYLEQECAELKLVSLVNQLDNHAALLRHYGRIDEFADEAISIISSNFDNPTFSNDEMLRLLFASIGDSMLNFFKISTKIDFSFNKGPVSDRMFSFLRLYVIFKKGGFTIKSAGRFALKIDIVAKTWDATNFKVANINEALAVFDAEELSVALFDECGVVRDLSDLNGFGFVYGGYVDISNEAVISVLSDTCVVFANESERQIPEFDVLVQEHEKDIAYVLLADEGRLSGHAELFVDSFIDEIEMSYPEFNTDSGQRGFSHIPSIFGITNCLRLYDLLDDLYQYLPCSVDEFIFNGVSYLNIFCQAFNLFCDGCYAIRVGSDFVRHLRSVNLVPINASVTRRLELYFELRDWSVSKWTPYVDQLLQRLCDVGLADVASDCHSFGRMTGFDRACSALIGYSPGIGYISDGIGIFTRRVCSMEDGILFSSLSRAGQVSLRTFIYCVIYCGRLPRDMIFKVCDEFVSSFGRFPPRLMALDNGDCRFAKICAGDHCVKCGVT